MVGAGRVAERKIDALLDAGARVRVVAPDGDRGCAAPGDARAARVAGAPLRGRGRRRGMARLRGDVGRGRCSAGSPRRRRRGASSASPWTTPRTRARTPAPWWSGRRSLVAISSSGAAPALTRLVREVVEHVLPGDDWIEHAKRLRAKWLAEGTPMGDRFAELVRDVKRGVSAALRQHALGGARSCRPSGRRCICAGSVTPFVGTLTVASVPSAFAVRVVPVP